MMLYIVRHGEADQREQSSGKPDAERALVPKGQRAVAEMAEALKKLKVAPGRVGTSPLRRAEETARIMAEILCPNAPLDVCDFLAPGGRTRQLVAWLRGLQEQSVMIVGHMPDFGRIASDLLAGTSEISIVFKKGAVCCISFEDVVSEGEGCLEWLLRPAHIRALSSTRSRK